jgi:hypothetical protein
LNFTRARAGVEFVMMFGKRFRCSFLASVVGVVAVAAIEKAYGVLGQLIPMFHEACEELAGAKAAGCDD